MNLEQYIETLKQLDLYETDTFLINIEILMKKATVLNYKCKEHDEKKDYIKRYLITHYFPYCYKLKVLDLSISEERGENGMIPLYCTIRLQTEEYKECVMKCLQHFLISPKWNVCSLSPINKQWHE